MLTSKASASPIRQCCARSALNMDAAFCDECGRAILRCMAHAECGSLLDDFGLCHVCVDLEVSLDAGAASSVREGGKLALPLVLRNSSGVGRPLFVTGLWIKEDDGALRPVPLPFERIEPQSQASVSVRTDTLDHAGMHQVDVFISVATRYQWRQEQFIFASYVLFPVESKDPGGPSTIVNVNADQVGAGFTVYNPTRIEADRAKGVVTEIAPVPLKVIRADAAERNLNVRGYDDGMQVPRGVAIAWRGFDKDEAPSDGPIVNSSGLLLAGRNSREAGNDLSLRLGVGKRSEALLMSISRLLFSLYTESGQFMLRVEGQYGLRVNNTSFERTQNVRLSSGDIIQPLRKQPKQFEIKVGFEEEHGVVTRIVLTRTTPKLGGEHEHV